MGSINCQWNHYWKLIMNGIDGHQLYIIILYSEHLSRESQSNCAVKTTECQIMIFTKCSFRLESIVQHSATQLYWVETGGSC